NISGYIAELSSQNLLYVPLNVSQALSTDEHRTNFREIEPAFTVHSPNDPARNAAPETDGKPISRPHDVIRTRRKIHWYQLRIAGTVFEYVDSESSRCSRVRRSL